MKTVFVEFFLLALTNPRNEKQRPANKAGLYHHCPSGLATATLAQGLGRKASFRQFHIKGIDRILVI